MPIARIARAGAIVARANTKLFERPDRLPRALLTALPWGASAAGVAGLAAGRYPEVTAFVDDTGSSTYAEMWRRTDALAPGLRRAGARSGVTVGLLGRNSRGFVEAMVAVAKTGANLVLLNTGFAGPQLADVVAAEDIALVLHDDEFTDTVAAAGCRAVSGSEMATMAAGRAPARLTPPRRAGRVVILTSGTTGRPKGAVRGTDPRAIEAVAGLLERIPLRVRDTQVVPAPLFHAWGMSHLLFGMSRAATTVLSSRFDPEATLRAIEQHRADVLVVVPVMLQRILALDPSVLAAIDTSSLRVIASSGSALGPAVVTAALERFGPVLYNIYGSTEVAMGTIATPADLARSPSTAGRPALGVTVEILDEQGQPVPAGAKGRVFVGGAGRFSGYTTGGGKEEWRGLLSSGDLGHFDRDGMLHVDGREDDMIVSGGENVFPVEVEELLEAHPDIAEVAVVGVDDEAFGQVLAAFVVRRPGATLGAKDVQQHVRQHLARYKVPRSVEFLDELPRTTTGKILRRVLAQS